MTASAQPSHEPRAPGAPSEGPCLEHARAFVRDALAALSPQAVLTVCVPVPAVPVEAPLRALRKTDAWVLLPERGLCVAGVGAAARVLLHGPTRLATARRACERLFDRVEARVMPGALALPLRAFVGLAFAPGSAAQPPWTTFGDGLLVLPRWTYACDGARASLTLALVPEAPLDPRLALAELEALLEAISRPPAPRPAPVVGRVEHLSPERWAQQVEAIRATIASGEASKVVAARRSIVTAQSDFEPLDVLARLRGQGCGARFLVRAGRTCLVGASPEHLFVQRGRRLKTEALAGSIGAADERADERLLASAKDREEHAHVVRFLLERLEPLAARITYPEVPEIRRLPNVLHLRTPIEAVLARATHPLDVLAALHPTPAVGGTPPERALQWILAHEAAPRGWYAGPIGWVDARGDGEMLVALRCGVVSGACAWLWAGSGIVAGSDPEREWHETALKMRPMLEALGAPT